LFCKKSSKGGKEEGSNGGKAQSKGIKTDGSSPYGRKNGFYFLLREEIKTEQHAPGRKYNREWNECYPLGKEKMEMNWAVTGTKNAGGKGGGVETEIFIKKGDILSKKDLLDEH